MPFADFIGNRTIVDRLRMKLREGRFPHGMIFSGPEGIGKRACALMLAKALNCDDLGPDDFCGLCGSCRRIDSGAHPDVRWVTVEEDASEIKIAQIRELLRILEFRPLEGRNKVFIVDPAGAMNSAAANALLKGLEEPPENSYWMLLTVNAQELLITVRSRCQVYRFAPLSRDEIRNCGVEDDLVVRWAQGSVGRARSLDAKELKAQREPLLEFFEIAAGAEPAQFAEMLSESTRLSRSKQRAEFRRNVEILGVLVGDLIYLDAGAPDHVINVDIVPRLEALARRVGPVRLVALADHLRFIESTFRNYLNAQMLTDTFALTASRAFEKFE